MFALNTLYIGKIQLTARKISPPVVIINFNVSYERVVMFLCTYALNVMFILFSFPFIGFYFLLAGEAGT